MKRDRLAAAQEGGGEVRETGEEFADRMMCRMLSTARSESGAVEMEMSPEMVESVLDEMDRGAPCVVCGAEIHPDAKKAETRGTP